MHILRHALAAITFIGVGCSEADRPPRSTAARAPAPAWYQRSRVMDVTDDGQPDTLWLRAVGTRADSLDISFTIISGGKEVLRENWRSSYVLTDLPFPQPAPAAVIDSFVRAKLDTTLSRVALDPVSELDFREKWPPVFADCTGDPRDCIAVQLREEAAAIDWASLPQDSAIAARERLGRAPFDTAAVQAIATDIRANTRQYLSLSYGYETTTSYAWSKQAGRFFMLLSCC